MINRSLQTGNSRNVIETILVLLLLVSLMFALYDVLKVFFGILTFALIFSVSFSGPFEWLARRLKNRRKLTAVIYSVVLLALIALPLLYILSTLRSHVKEAIEWLADVKQNGLPPLPKWVGRLPLAGDEISGFWTQLQSSPRETVALHGEQVKTALRHILSSGAGMIGTALQFIIGVFISAFFLASGEQILRPIKLTMQHLLGRKEGLSLLRATTHAIKGVSIGVMGTALIAAIISWIGLAIAGVNFALVLSALVFFLVLIQLGPLLVWIPLVIWSAAQGHTGMTIFLIIYGIALLIIDAFLKPILIARSGGKIPFLVMFIGVIGGLAAWGLTGMFKGAIIVSVFYTLGTAWLEKKNTPGKSTATKPPAAPST